MSAALIAMELALRPFSTVQPAPRPRIAADSFGAPVVTTRQMEEGIGVANYTVAGARLTGLEPVPHAPLAVVLGDSYVEAREIRDHETLGAWIERLSRAEGRPMNVRQYGWRGANPAQYLLVAPEVFARWRPQVTIILLSADDLDHHPLTFGYPRLRIGVDGQVTLIHEPATSPRPAAAMTAWSRLVNGVMSKSTVVALLRRRRDLMLSHAPLAFRKWRAVRTASAAVASPNAAELPITGAELAAVPSVVVDELHRAYGDRLVIAYAANVWINSGDVPDSLEVALMARCRLRQVVCLSLRDDMVKSRNRGAAVRGFSTTNLVGGHLNATGHEVAGRALWEAIKRREGFR